MFRKWYNHIKVPIACSNYTAIIYNKNAQSCMHVAAKLIRVALNRTISGLHGMLIQKILYLHDCDCQCMSACMYIHHGMQDFPELEQA